jgi:putative ABC transport system permease protein
VIRLRVAADDGQVAALKDRLADAGYTGTTAADQLGTIKAVVDGIVLVFNAFAVIALLAASFGIVDTLLMSVRRDGDRVRGGDAAGRAGGSGAVAALRVAPRGLPLQNIG